MSLPSLHLVCDVCGDRAKLGPFPPAFYLTDGDGLLPVWWTVGWCTACGHSRRLENWPHEAALILKKSELDSIDVEWQTRQREATPPPRLGRWMERLFGRAPETPITKLGEMSHHAQELADLQCFHRLLNLRQSTNRCMDCGSTHVWHWNLEKEPAPEHPGCGGYFQSSDESGGMRLGYRGMAVLYSLEGLQCGTVQTSSRDGRPTAEDLVASRNSQPDEWWKAPGATRTATSAEAARPNNAREGLSKPSSQPNKTSAEVKTNFGLAPWPKLADYPQTEDGFNRYMNTWATRRRAARMLRQIPMLAVEEHRAAVALAQQMGWEEREEE
jgi:hypothetical protein